MLTADLASLLSRRAHLVTYEELRLLGYDTAEIARLVRTRDLVRLRQGCYTSGEHWMSLGTPPHRELLRARAASTVMDAAHVLSHDSAAHALSMPFLMPPTPLVHVSRPHVHGSRTKAGVKHHGAPYEAAQVVQAQGLAVLGAARTAADLAREHGFHAGLSACDSALRQGATLAELEAAVSAMTSWPGVRSARRAIALADAGAENPGESLARIMALETGAGPVATQVPFRIPTGVAWCDMVVGAHVIEFDGRIKYRRREEGGVAETDSGEVVWRERQRERELLRLGLGVSRLVWDDLHPARWGRTRQRLSDEIGQTFSRGGHTLPAPLAEQVAAMTLVRESRLRRSAHAA